MHTTIEGKILGVASLVGALAILGGLYWLLKDGNADLDPVCLEENRKISGDNFLGSLGIMPNLKDCRKDIANQ